MKLNAGDDALATANGIKVIRIPISTVDQTIGEPSINKVFGAVNSIIQNRNRGGVLVHCEHGCDRTGIIIAIYKVTAYRTSKAKARADMLAHGYHPLLRGLEWAWEDYLK